MEGAVWTCSPEGGLAEAEGTMRRANGPCLLVIEESERVIGPRPLAEAAQPADSGPSSPSMAVYQAGDTSRATGDPEAPRCRTSLPVGAPWPGFARLEDARTRRGSGRLSDAVGGRRLLCPGTVALRWCSDCRRFLGVKLWPRSGLLLIHTHGLCHACYRRMMRRLMTDALPGPVLLGAEEVGIAGGEPLL